MPSMQGQVIMPDTLKTLVLLLRHPVMSVRAARDVLADIRYLSREDKVKRLREQKDAVDRLRQLIEKQGSQ